jgi:hypothetical protein
VATLRSDSSWKDRQGLNDKAARLLESKLMLGLWIYSAAMLMKT